ncbi:MAG: hypothetical protein GWN00_28645, partial [Aliifodinibius sp.]|nr:hypothetical protein [Fodinibius sp.]NIV14732.1 hypothetical protein [Fodinibius sp.]NIY28627.1 hypothetical protein [Fodinibius sp.]
MKAASSTLATISKPGVESKDKVIVGQYPKDELYRNIGYEDALHSDLLAVSMVKPIVHPDDIASSGHQFDLDGEIVADNSSGENESSDE